MNKLILIICITLLSVSCGHKVQGVEAVKRYINGVELVCPKDIMHPKTSIRCRVASLTSRSTTSANGLNVWVEDGATVTPESIEAIERGMTRAIKKSLCKGYGREGWRALRINDYTVAVLKSTEFDSQGNPSFRQPCANYCGSEYDKGGYILVGGQMVATGIPLGNIFAIPESKGKYDYTSNASEYELEHLILSWYDGSLFLSSQYHGAGFGHPIYSCTSPQDNFFFVEPTQPQIKDIVPVLPVK